MPDKPMTRQEQFRSVGKLIQDCMYDRELRERFLKDPRATLKEAGLELSPHAKIHVHENKLDEHHFIVPVFFESPIKTATDDHPLLPTEEELAEHARKKAAKSEG